MNGKGAIRIGKAVLEKSGKMCSSYFPIVDQNFKWLYLSHLWTEYGLVGTQIMQNYKGYLMEGDRSWSDLVQARKCPKTTSGKGKLKKWLTSVRKDLN